MLFRNQVKFAVSVIAEFIVIVAGLFEPVWLPVPVPVQDRNLCPVFVIAGESPMSAVAVRIILCPALNHPLLGATDPTPDGFTFMVRRYCFWNVAV
jgi:hypothetical protein